ncbi:MAG: type VI secretion system baseplate subunit TssG [Chitinispirillales bacterium]|jgi:type VI secretion system protein ImpH|nr:type VI secretion system baseplate subunit TssG [Chitinispirillales bacterium]
MDELIRIIEREYYTFDVLQLVAVIEELSEDGGGGVNADNRGRICFEVDADLSFPPSDVGYVGVDEGCANNSGRTDTDNPAVTVRLPVMNLLGSSSPLPAAFSDRVTRGRPDADIYAGFLSIMQNRLHALWLDAQRKNALWGPSTPLASASPNERRAAAAEKIFKFMAGVSIDKKGGVEFALSGLRQLSNRARSAQGLKELLYAALGDIPVSIEENVGRLAAVSNARPPGGGARLGKNAVLGARVYDRTSKFRVTLGPLDPQTYKAFMPGGSGYRLVNEVLSAYLNEPVICELSVTCRLGDLPRARLGGGRHGGDGELGRTAALGGGRRCGDRTVGRTETAAIRAG